MTPFLAVVTVTRTPYMSESRTYQKNHLVLARDAQEAHLKVLAYYDAQSKDYSVSYQADVEITETIQ